MNFTLVDSHLRLGQQREEEEEEDQRHLGQQQEGHFCLGQ